MVPRMRSGTWRMSVMKQTPVVNYIPCALNSPANAPFFDLGAFCPGGRLHLCFFRWSRFGWSKRAGSRLVAAAEAAARDGGGVTPYTPELFMLFMQ